MTTDRTKRPSYQWYPGDWRRDLALQACSFEARALWREMLDLMHDGEPYGHLTAGGVPIDVVQLARLIGIPLQKARRWLAELEDRKVFSRTEAGVIYSRRMVRDEIEYLAYVERQRENGRRGGRPRGNPPETQPITQTKATGNPTHNPEESRGKPLQSAVSQSAQEPTTSPLPPTAAPDGADKPKTRPARKLSPTPDERTVLEHYRTRHPRSKPNSDNAIRTVRRALAMGEEGYSATELCEAIDGNAWDPWHTENAKNELGYVLRDSDQIDKFRELARRKREGIGPANGRGGVANRTFQNAQRVLAEEP